MEVAVLNKYKVLVGKNALSNFSKINLKKYPSIFLVADEKVWKLWSEKIEKVFGKRCKKIILKSNEQIKNIDNVQKIWQKLLVSGCDRKTLLINLGGGVIGDLGGFSASTYMRGIDFIHIPTTLTGQADSAIGGKVGINFAEIKNLIGNFNQPVAVICDTGFLSTLPKREFISGFAEIIKHGLILDRRYFEFVSSKKPLDFTNQELRKIILNSIKIKAKIVNQDEKETNYRKLLNFGHTIGHAIESLSLETPAPLLHGEAISIGIIVEARISNLIRKLPSSDLQLIRQSLINAALPISMPKIDPEKIIKKMLSDKKNVKGKINFTLLKGIGEAIVNQTIPDNIIRKALI